MRIKETFKNGYKSKKKGKFKFLEGMVGEIEEIDSDSDGDIVLLMDDDGESRQVMKEDVDMLALILPVPSEKVEAPDEPVTPAAAPSKQAGRRNKLLMRRLSTRGRLRELKAALGESVSEETLAAFVENEKVQLEKEQALIELEAEKALAEDILEEETGGDVEDADGDVATETEDATEALTTDAEAISTAADVEDAANGEATAEATSVGHPYVVWYVDIDDEDQYNQLTEILESIRGQALEQDEEQQERFAFSTPSALSGEEFEALQGQLQAINPDAALQDDADDSDEDDEGTISDSDDGEGGEGQET